MNETEKKKEWEEEEEESGREYEDWEEIEVEHESWDSPPFFSYAKKVLDELDKLEEKDRAKFLAGEMEFIYDDTYEYGFAQGEAEHGY
jgi:hypothetical protein